MILLTPGLRQRLLANGQRRCIDHVPVVKLFNPIGIGTWLATELDEDGETLFGLADPGGKACDALPLLAEANRPWDVSRARATFLRHQRLERQAPLLCMGCPCGKEESERRAGTS